MPRKRTRDEMEASEPPAQQTPDTPLITKIRNMWEFASVMQFIQIFGSAVRIDPDFDIEDFEEECLKPTPSDKLEEIGLTLLKWISSFRGLELSNWDEYTRRQYEAKAPHLSPYGTEEDLKHFRDFDIGLKIRVLHQLTIWVFWNPDRIKERMPEATDARQTEWRVEEFGWDRDDRSYYVLDDNRLYRRTEPSLPPTPKAAPKKTSKKAQAARRRASKRQKLENSSSPEPQDDEVEQENEDSAQDTHVGTPSGLDVNTLGGYTWECIAITLAEYQAFVESIKKTKDPNEKSMRDRLVSDIIPLIELPRISNAARWNAMATAKRSSRIAGKQEREKAEREAEEAERKRRVDLAAARREQERLEQMEDERNSRMMTREQRIKDREYKRILAEEELARSAAVEEAIANGEARGSERQIKERLARNKKKLDEIISEEDEDNWMFDCSGCGLNGINKDDGSHSISCERCKVWQHSKCLKISEKDADRDDFHFICRRCHKKEEDAKRPKISLKFKTGQSSSSPPQNNLPQPSPSPRKQVFTGVEVPRVLLKPDRRRMATMRRRLLMGHVRHLPARMALKYPFVVSPYQQAGSPPLQTNPMGSPPLQSGQPWGPPPPQQYAQPRPSSSGYQYSNQGHSHAPPPQPVYPTQFSQTFDPATGPRPPSSGGGSRPTSSHGQVNGTTPAAQLPSPVVNRPVISPSQGNYDVGPVAGIPPHNRQPQRTPSFTNGTPAPLARQESYSSSPPLSGLSPSKNPTPRAQNYQATPAHQNGTSLPPPSAIPVKPVTSPVAATQRTVSGTPIFPPSEKLAPTPDRGHLGPQPTPSKHEIPVPNHMNANDGDVVMNGTQDHELSSAQRPHAETIEQNGQHES
ncbi:uncharacterized protein AB675_6181 [Cyphellophora attinorum]|uniref:Zinc finger PHD-type domain-containing protein n=1 Tax=Cyphellophora attinorum TaxID=1664694 RepID=A0A0N1HZG8_9EURO|nr:uncharacterized protein AB675_6181 [Phialophora attinorum]KPI44187.1 hypothetical protein AB675_6181 [Phialophora attinorum]